MTCLLTTANLSSWAISLQPRLCKSRPHKFVSIFITSITLALLCVSVVPAYAEKPKKKIDWYQVEVIIFSQQDLFNEERHRKDVELAFPENIRQLLDTESKSELKPGLKPEFKPELKPELKQEPQPNSTDDQAFLVLTEDSMEMVPDRDRLRRAPGYRVLYHKAWRQPGLGRTESPWIFIQGGEQTGDRHELEGSFRLVRNRYLHVQANLWKAKLLPARTRFNQPATYPSSVATGVSGSASMPFQNQVTANIEENQWPHLPALPIFQAQIEEEHVTGDNKTLGTQTIDINKQTLPSTQPLASTSNPLMADSLIENPLVQKVVVLNQSTRVTRNELTYLDHPNMGAIVLVTKYESEKDDAE